MLTAVTSRPLDWSHMPIVLESFQVATLQSLLRDYSTLLCQMQTELLWLDKVRGVHSDNAYEVVDRALTDVHTFLEILK